MSKTIEVIVPDIGDDGEVDVIELLVAEGDTVEVDQSLITVESDKASMEIPSSHAGVVKALKVNIGDKVKQGSLILELDASADAAPAEKADEAPAPAEQASAPAPVAQEAAAPAAASAAAAGGAEQVITVEVPDIGDATDVDVIEVLVAVGDTIEADQSLITLETDKASMEVPSSHAGVIEALSVKVGDKVSQGSAILQLRVSGGAAAPAAEQSAAPAPAAAPVENVAKATTAVVGSAAGVQASESPVRESPTSAYSEADVPARNLPHASPSVRRFARELGVNLLLVKGSGNKGRITPDDVRQYVKSALANQGSASAPAVSAGGGLDVLAWPKVDFTRFGEIETQPLSRIKKISGANLHRNWVMIPHVTNN